MKSNVILRTAAAVILLAILSVSSLRAQTATSSSTAAIMPLTGSEVLANILAAQNQTPLNIYPPGYLDWLSALGNNPLPVPAGPQRPTRAQPVGRLITSGISVGGGGRFGMMSMSRPNPNDPSPQYTYEIIDLGTLGGSQSLANAINAKGQIVGWSQTTGNSAQHACLWQNANSAPQDLGTPFSSVNSYGYAINGNNWITGYASSAGGTSATLWQNGVPSFLNGYGLAGTSALGVNDNGWVVGAARDNAYYVHAFLWTNGVMQIIAFNGQASAIDSFGDVVGVYGYNSGTPHAFLFTNGAPQYTPIDLGTLGGAHSAANAIDSYAEVVGGADTSSGHDAFFYDYQSGTMQDLGTLNGGTSDAYGINDNAHVVGSSNGRAFIVSNGSMQDLNNEVVNGTGWTLLEANAINNSEQIVGYGLNPSGQYHAFMLKPVPLGWNQTITANTTRQGFNAIPNPPSGVDSIIVVTHGRIPAGDDPAVSTAWVDSMVTTISSYLTTQGLNNWGVIGYKWIGGASQFLPDTVLGNAKQQGVALGLQIIAGGYTHVHLIAHSAGAGLIQEATDVIKAHNPSVVVHETFLDPYVGWNFSGTSSYGNGADWADNYSTKDDETFNGVDSGQIPFTYNILSHAYNVDVTYVDVNDRVQRPYFVSGNGSPCYVTKSVHIWPVNFYSNSIVGRAVTSDYQGFGFPLSEEGGMWGTALTYTPGNGAPGHILGTPDPACFLDIPAPSYPSSVMDFLGNPSQASTTGTINKYPNGSLIKKSGSPAWLATFVIATNPVNVVSFDAEFQDAAGSQGLETIYWDTNVIGTIDERVVQDGFQHYTFKFQSVSDSNVHVLGFRLDPFTNIQSIVVITNVALTYSGVSQPFTLSITGSTNGFLWYQLNGQPGFEYTIQASSDLTSSANWTNVAIVANTNGIVQFFDQSSTNQNQRFYRAVAPY